MWVKYQARLDESSPASYHSSICFWHIRFSIRHSDFRSRVVRDTLDGERETNFLIGCLKVKFNNQDSPNVSVECKCLLLLLVNRDNCSAVKGTITYISSPSKSKQSILQAWNWICFQISGSESLFPTSRNLFFSFLFMICSLKNKVTSCPDLPAV